MWGWVGRWTVHLETLIMKSEGKKCEDAATLITQLPSSSLILREIYVVCSSSTCKKGERERERKEIKRCPGVIDQREGKKRLGKGPACMVGMEIEWWRKGKKNGRGERRGMGEEGKRNGLI